MNPLNDNERQLLEKLADAGKPTELGAEESLLGQILERRGLIFFVSDGAIISPKGRHLLAGDEAPKIGSKKKRLGLLD